MPTYLTLFESGENHRYLRDTRNARSSTSRRSNRSNRRSNRNNSGSGDCDASCDDGLAVTFTIIGLGTLLWVTYSALEANKACLFDHSENFSLRVASGVLMVSLGGYCGSLAFDAVLENDDLSSIEQGSLGTLTAATVEAAFVLTWVFYWTKIHPELTCPCDLSMMLNHLKLSAHLSDEAEQNTTNNTESRIEITTSPST